LGNTEAGSCSKGEGEGSWYTSSECEGGGYAPFEGNTYVHGRYIDEVITARLDGADYYYHRDDLYNVTALTDGAGAVDERYEYSPFGAPSIYNASGTKIESSAYRNDVLFTGQRYDAETGLYYYRLRNYDPQLGRFISPDPIGAWGDPNNLGNTYAYVGNSPWMGVEPMGLSMADIPDSLINEIQTVADSVMAMSPPPGLGKLDAGTWWHGRFREQLDGLGNPRILTEKSIGQNGNLVKWGEGLSKRPDAIILKQGVTIKDVVKSNSFAGLVDGVVDLKTGVTGISNSWAREVARRLEVPLSDIQTVRGGANLGNTIGLAKCLGKKFGGKALVVAGVLLAYQDARAQGWGTDEAQLYAAASVFGGDLLLDAFNDGGEAFWGFAEKHGNNEMIVQHIDTLHAIMDEVNIGNESYDQRGLDSLLNQGKTPTVGDILSLGW
jgi:RHS repeat-associated protein